MAQPTYNAKAWAAIDSKILGALNEQWLSEAELCRAIGASEYDSKTVGSIRRLRRTKAIDYCTVPTQHRNKFRYVYRRKVE